MSENSPTLYASGILKGVLSEKRARLEALDAERADLVTSILELESAYNDLHVA